MTNLFNSKRRIAVGVAAVLCLGLAACSGGAEPGSEESATASADPKDEQAAREALVSTELAALSEHEPEAKDPEYVAEERFPFADCVGKGPKSLEIAGYVTREFSGDPKLRTSGYAVDGDADGAFRELRERWEGDDCQSHQTDTDKGTVTFVQSQEIDRPDAVDAGSWFGACYTAFRAKDDESGKCVVVYRLGDSGIAEVVTSHGSGSNLRMDDFLKRLAAESRGG